MDEAERESGGAALLAEALDGMIQRFGAAENAPDLVRARAEFDERRGKVREDEELWEPWTSAFLEWYVVERPHPVDRRPPAVRALALENRPARAAAIRAWLRSHRALAEVRGLSPGKVTVADLVGGARFAVSEKRALHGVTAGDVVEVRLVGFEGGVYFGRTFCYHPSGTRDLLEGHVRRLAGLGEGRAEILDYCARLRIRCERYAHVAPKRIYEAATGELPLAPEAGGERAP
jgi:hypothetical protein